MTNYDIPQNRIAIQAKFVDIVRKRAADDLLRNGIWGGGAGPVRTADAAGTFVVSEDEEDLRESMVDDLVKVMAQDDGPFGSTGDLQAVRFQLDYLDTRRRAEAIRRTSLPRRLAHTAMRRQSRANNMYKKRVEEHAANILAGGTRDVAS